MIFMVNKRTHPKFRIPNFGAKSRKGVKARWRKQRGIDNKKRTERHGYGASPKIGYKNPEGVRFARKDGSMEVLVHNEKELLAVQKEAKQVAVFAHELSIKKKTFLQKIANGKGIRVVNKVSA